MPGSAECSLEDIAKRPQVRLRDLKSYDDLADVPDDVLFQVELSLKYDGYIARQNREIDRYHQMEDQKMPTGFDYSRMKGLSNEARAKLEKVRPVSIGQAGRIDGVTPADISVLLVALSNRHRAE